MKTGSRADGVWWGQGITVRFNLVFFSVTDVILLHYYILVKNILLV